MICSGAQPLGQKAKKKKQQSAALEDSSGAAEGAFDVDVVKERMGAAIDSFRKATAALKPGRASPHMFDNVKVKHPGTGDELPLPSVGRAVARDAQRLEVTVYDVQLASAVAKAIAAASKDLNPLVERNMVVVPLPRSTAEQRKEMIKQAHAIAEKTKTSVRRARQDALKDIRALGSASADEKKRLSEQVQDITDEAVKGLEKQLGEKEVELETM